MWLRQRGGSAGGHDRQCPLAVTADEGMRQSHPLKTFVVFVVFVVKSPFTRPSEGKGFIYHEDREDTKKGIGFGVWLGGNR